MEVQPAVLKISEGLRIEDTVELISKNTTIDIDPNNPPNNSTGQVHELRVQGLNHDRSK